MKRFLHASLSLALMAMLGNLPLLGQGGGSGQSAPRGGSGSTTPGTTRPPRSPSQPMDQGRGPIFLTGRVLTELARPVSEPVSIELNCGMRTLQVIHTDLGGYFTFNLGGGTQGNLDFSASNESTQSFGSQMTGLSTQFSNPLAGCELRLAVAGYRPLNITLTHNADLGRVDVGNIHLQRIGAAKGTGISVTSLLVPKDASKEYERAVKDIQNNKPEAALPHLQKAVELYDKYAAAWNAIGQLYLGRNLVEKAEKAFEKAVEADADYIPPWISLATIQIQDREWEKGVETARKVLALDPDVGFASFLEAVGNFNLNHLEEAERNAQEAEKAPHANNPQVHALLAQIYMQKQDYPQAADHMRSYLKESPDGQYAEQMKKDLDEIEQWTGKNGSDSTSAPAVPGS